MKIFLAYCCDYSAESFLDKHKYFMSLPDYLLESFYYVQDWQLPFFKKYKEFMLDSGVFTFIQKIEAGKERDVDWEEYNYKYAQFIKEHNINLFFELDIDYEISIKDIEKLRSKLESITGKKCIPVWHKPRGVEYFKKMCIQYNYVAIGASGLNEDSKWTRSNPEMLKWFINYAHSQNVRIHGLGYSSMKYLKEMRFDSVDTTSWKSGNRFNTIFEFRNGRVLNVAKNIQQKRKHFLIIQEHNLKEWVKFQKYAEEYL